MDKVNLFFTSLPFINTAMLAFGLYTIATVPATQPQLTAAHQRIGELELRQTNTLQHLESRHNALASSVDDWQNETQRRFKVLEARIASKPKL